jgi:hypothetical protein
VKIAGHVLPDFSEYCSAFIFRVKNGLLYPEDEGTVIL